MVSFDFPSLNEVKALIQNSGGGSKYLPLTGGTLTGSLTVNGESTFNSKATFQNTDYTSGVENQVVKYRFKTGSNQYGAIYFGKEGPNNGAMIRLDQVEGTARLYFRASSTAGAIVWNQPESSSQLYFDVSKINFRTAGYSADATAFRPSSNGTRDLGASAYKFRNVYGTTFYEDGTALASKYAAKSHNHAISDITSLQSALDAKVNKSDVIDEYQVGQGTTYEGKVSSVKGVINYVADNVLSQKGKTSGFASLDSSGKVPSSQLPSYVDDVLEFTNQAAFPQTGEDGKIYIAEDTNKQYRWSGSAYVEISSSLALGETASTAYAGSKGKQNADDIASLKTSKANVSDVYTKEQANLLINNKADKSHRHVASDITDLQDKLDDKLNIANSTYIFGDTASETKFNLMELGTMPARTRIIQFVGDPNVDPVISVGFGNGNGLNVHYDSLKHKVNNTEYDVLDTSMELSYQDTLDYLNSL